MQNHQYRIGPRDLRQPGVRDPIWQADVEIQPQGKCSFILEELSQAAVTWIDPAQKLPFIKAKRDGVIGLAGVTYWGWLHIDILWVEECLRQRGIGQRLLQNTEEVAVERGCRYTHLETHSFQALEFYEKHGYQVYGELPDLPGGYTIYFLKKNLKVKKGINKDKREGCPKPSKIKTTNSASTGKRLF